MELITVFTPTYNRGYILSQLYQSLVNQTNQSFIWLIVDDGSTDQTEQLVRQWIIESKIKIEYYYQTNQGKSMAHNRGVSLTRTELFACVDSDDYLASCAIEKILLVWENKTERYTGILAFKGYSSGDPVTEIKNSNCESSTLKNAYVIHGLVGDTMLIFRTDIISKYEFPFFPGEKFVPESYLYDLIDQHGELILLKKVLYYCEYLEDGYSKNLARFLKNNPQGYLAYITQRLRFDKTIKERFLDSIRYVAMGIVVGEKQIIRKSVYPFITFLAYPAGVLFYFYRWFIVK